MNTKPVTRASIVVAAGLLAVACTATAPSDLPGTAAAPAATSSTAAASSSAAKPQGQAQPGDLNKPGSAAAVGAPIDPCKVGWAKFPASVRPIPDKPPTVQPVTEKSVYATACRYDNSVSDKKTDPHFFVTVFWAAPVRISTDPAREGGTAESFNGKPGVIRSGKEKDTEEPTCGVLVGLANGTAGILVTNGRFPSEDPCSIARGVAQAVAASTP